MSHNVLQAWEGTLRRSGSDRAVVQATDGATATFRELDGRASEWLRSHASDTASLKGRAVVFSAPNGIPWLAIFLGLLKAGAVVLPLDPAEPRPSQRRLAEGVRAGFWWDGAKLVGLAGARRYRDPAACLIKLTSGTTGNPRAFLFTAEQMLADSRQVTSTMGIGCGDLNYGLVPLGHSYGLGNLTLPLLAQGVPLVCGSAFLPQAIAADFEKWMPTVFPGVPAVWRALAASEVALPGLRLAISAGSSLPADVARDFAARFGLQLHSFYGSSETGGISYDATGKSAVEGNVGKALRGVRLRVLPGEKLMVSSAAVFTHGNRRRDGAMGAMIMPDRVVLDAGGRVVLRGRRGTTVKISGRRVSLSEVCDRLRGIPGVREAWVGVTIGADPALGAVVSADRVASELRAELLADTAAWKIPRKLVVVRALPMTARGKFNTRALRSMIS